MKWNIERSNEVKKQIAGNEELMKQLSESVAAILQEFGVNLEGMSYIFEPRVFHIDEDEIPEMQIKSHTAMLKALIDDWKYGNMVERAEDHDWWKPEPIAGPMDPLRLSMIEKYRIMEKHSVKDDLIPIKSSEALIRSIVENKELLATLSGKVFEILAQNDIMFDKEEGCLFTPVLFETPVYAQIVGKVNDYGKIRGFGPSVFAKPDPTPWMPGVIQVGDGLTVGVLIKDVWRIGIPAPEGLRALDVMRRR